MCGRRCSRRERGFTAVELLTVVTIVTGLSATAFVRVKNTVNELKCRGNLTQVGMDLRFYETQNGRLPAAAFYPANPREAKDSLYMILPDSRQLLLCPSAPDEFSAKGLTFLWNDKMNNRIADKIENASETWLMTEMNAVSDKVPAPHPGGYNILCADLHTAKAEKEVPKDLADMIKALKETKP